MLDIDLVRMKVDIKMAEDVWKKALKLPNSDCQGKYCERCEKV